MLITYTKDRGRLCLNTLPFSYQSLPPEVSSRNHELMISANRSKSELYSGDSDDKSSVTIFQMNYICLTYIVCVYIFI